MANIYTDMDGKTISIKARALFAAAYRASAVQEEEGDEALLAAMTDDQVIAVIEQYPGNENSEKDGEAVRKSRLVALVEESEHEDADEAPSGVASKSELSILARKQTELFDKDVDSVLESIADAKETQTGGPVLLADHLFDLYGGERDKDSGMMTACPKVMAFPVPGSSYKSDFWKTRNETPDIHRWKDHATGTEYTIRFYRDLADSTPLGKQLLTDIDDLTRLKDSKDGIKNKELLHYHGKSDQRIAKLAQLKARRAARSNAFGRAIGFLQTITRWNEHLDQKGTHWGFSVADATDNMDEVARRNRPIKLSTIKGKEVSSSDPISLSQFISLQHPAKGANKTRFELAVEKGGTVGNVLDTLKKAAKSPDEASKQGGNQDKTGKDIGIPSPNELVAYANMFCTGLDETGNKAMALAYRSRLMKHFNVQTSEVTEELMTLQELVNEMVAFLTPYQPRIQKGYEEQAKAA